MIDPNAATVDSLEEERSAGSAIHKEQNAAKRLMGAASKKIEDQALAVFSRSPAAANPWVRGILLVNNIFNRLLGRPPGSAENIKIGAQVLAAMAVVNLFINLWAVFLIGGLITFFIVHPEEIPHIGGFFVDLFNYLKS